VAHPSNNPLDVPHYPQVDDGYCLPACVQMVMAYLGLPSTQDRLARELDVRPPLGAPASNVIRLRSDVLDVTFTSGSLNDLRSHLTQGDPPIVFVQAGEFPHWQGRVAQHAVVVVGMDEQAVQVLDPAAGASPISVPIGDFMLAWSELDYIYALIVRSKPR
jgi:ABC-type bacteriocin/lantibiotic exporter with double-glycine peptidase domain